MKKEADTLSPGNIKIETGIEQCIFFLVERYLSFLLHVDLLRSVEVGKKTPKHYRDLSVWSEV